jgi:hypothetical protein
MSTYTDSLGFEEITPGDQAGLWGNTTNNNLALIDQAIAGVQPLSFAGVGGTTITLEATEGSDTSTARSAVLNITGNATAANTVIVPNKQKTYLVRNSTGRSITFRTATMVEQTIVAASNNTLIFCDGNNGVFPGIAAPGVGPTLVSGGGTGVTTFTAGFLKSPGSDANLTTQASIGVGGTATNDITGQVQVVNGGTGLSNVPIGSLVVGGVSTMTVLAQGNNGQVLTSNGAGVAPSFKDAASGVASVTSGGNITVSPTTGAVVVSLSGSNVTNALGYTPASLSANNTFSGFVNATAFTATSAGSIGDQKFQVSFGGYSSGMSPQGMQIGASGRGIIYDGNYIALGGINGGTVLSLGSTTGVFISSTDNVQKPTGGSWLSSSDSRLKENINPYTKGLDAVKSLRTVTFNLKEDVPGREKYRIDPTKSITGIIAQEVLETPLASIISEGSDGYYMVDPSEITWTLVNAVKELSAKIDAQAAEIAALKAK